MKCSLQRCLACSPILLVVLLLFPSAVRAEVAPAATIVPDAEAWVGQRVPFYVELRARGTFAGTASFELPQLPRTLLIKIGEPVVGSQEIEDETWFVQTHEFALFSQSPGPLEVPAVAVRFGRREGFTGPAHDVQAQAPGFEVEIKRPPGSDEFGFLITTESLDVTETWDPAPGPTEVGAIFKRTIVQRAPQLPGMALAPAPGRSPDGIRAYPGDAATNDRLTRGEFLGERRETITYLVQKPGTFELPALRYVWWNPKMEKLQSKTLPSVTFEVAAPPAVAVEEPTVTRSVRSWLPAAALLLGAGVLLGRRLAAWGRRYRRQRNAPDRVAARKLLRACRRHDAAAAETAWSVWRNAQGAGFQPGPELRVAILGLQRRLFGPAPAVVWRGDPLARAFGEHGSTATTRDSREPASALPALNPPG